MKEECIRFKKEMKLDLSSSSSSSEIFSNDFLSTLSPSDIIYLDDTTSTHNSSINNCSINSSFDEEINNNNSLSNKMDIYEMLFGKSCDENNGGTSTITFNALGEDDENFAPATNEMLASGNNGEIVPSFHLVESPPHVNSIKNVQNVQNSAQNEFENENKVEYLSVEEFRALYDIETLSPIPKCDLYCWEKMPPSPNPYSSPSH